MKNYKEDFSLLKESNIVYLDSGATSQKPDVVLNAINEYYSKYNANPHRGTYELSIEATEKYEEARGKIRNFINAKSNSEIVFTKNATEALNLIAYSYGLDNLKNDDEVVISIMEHHSNLVPWQMVTKKTGSKLNYLYVNKETLELEDDEIENKITKNTKIVSITHISNVTGYINDIERIIKKAHSVGAIVIVDCSQSIMHLKIDVQKLDVDFIVFSAHKMYGPMGVGVLYGKESILNKMNPFLMGGDMISYVYEDKTTFADLPNKFEAGTQNVGDIIATGYAIDYIESVGYENIHEKENKVFNYALEELSKLDFLDLYIPKNREHHAPIISFNIKNIHPHDVASILDDFNVCVRAGNHCAQPYLRYLGIESTLRASFMIYNEKEDVDTLVKGLKQTYEKFKKYIK